MKPPIEYRAKSASPKPKAGGRWVWVPNDRVIVTRLREERKTYMRRYMQKRRAKAKAVTVVET